jgi:cytoskeletal protein RodZ
MKAVLVSTALGLGLLLSAGAYAQAPAGATASCKDGTYYTGTTHKGACRGHKGVKEWLNGGTSSSATSKTTKSKATSKSKSKKSAKSKKPAAAETAAPANASTAATPAAPAAPAAKAKSPRFVPTAASQIAQKPGGGPGLVWVNANSKVYHCQGDPWYGKTKEGSYMTEAAAKAAGNHGSHGKDCGK